MITPEILQRFWSKVEKTGSCWNWIAGLNSDGYGQFRLENKKLKSYRFSYELFKGEIPKGLEIDHLCRNRKCVNPNHLEAVTHRENVMRGNGVAATYLKRTHCPQGHPYSGDNLIIRKDGGRRCKICREYYNKVIKPQTKERIKNG